MAKWFRIRKPSLRLTSKGPKIRAPSVRVGGKAGINVSKSGVSGSVRTPLGSYSTRRGLTSRMPRLFSRGSKSSHRRKGCLGCLPGCGLFIFVGLVAFLIAWRK
jgi:hypothetical protein